MMKSTKTITLLALLAVLSAGGSACKNNSGAKVGSAIDAFALAIQNNSGNCTAMANALQTPANHIRQGMEDIKSTGTRPPAALMLKFKELRSVTGDMGACAQDPEIVRVFETARCR